MVVDANPNERSLLTFQGALSVHVKAASGLRVSHPFSMVSSLMTVLNLSHARTGWLTPAFSGQEHDGLQQSQNLEVMADLDAARVEAGRITAAVNLHSR